MDFGVKHGGTPAWSFLSRKGSRGNVVQREPPAHSCKVGGASVIIFKCSKLSGPIEAAVRNRPVTGH